jgi:hypothetical protein
MKAGGIAYIIRTSRCGPLPVLGDGRIVGGVRGSDNANA